jgi:hypothetical protein
MGFSRENMNDFIKILRQTLDTIKFHQWHHLIYNVDETGLKLTYNSGNQKLLAVKGSRRDHTDTEQKGFSQWFCVRESTQGFEFK